MKSTNCGATILTYDDDCSYVCVCNKDECRWSIMCGPSLVKGSGKPRLGGGRAPSGEVVKVDGKLSAIAKVLGDQWGSHVVTPRGSARLRVTKRLRGSNEEICRSLGLRHEGSQ